MIKYSRSGVIEGEFLSSSMFGADAQRVVADGLPAGNQLWIDRDRLFVYLSQPQELLHLDLDGNLKKRYPLRALLADLGSKVTDAPEVVAMGNTDTEDTFVAQVRF